jgi:small GTP-binding protein
MDRFTEGAHRLAYSATVGIDFKVRRLDIDNKTVKMQIWDTAGQEKFNSITTAYYRQARAAIVMYDVTRPATFQNLRKWFTLIDTHARTDVTKILVGNKTDQKDERVVTIEQGKRAAEEFGAEFFESSAKSDSNVYRYAPNRSWELIKLTYSLSAFEFIATDVIQKMPMESNQLPLGYGNGIRPRNSDKTSNPCTC